MEEIGVQMPATALCAPTAEARQGCSDPQFPDPGFGLLSSGRQSKCPEAKTHWAIP